MSGPVPFVNPVRPKPAAPRPTAAPPTCPVCGGLECLCRPRFYAGQLLTEEELNALDRYVVEKNKLHNRYLHGWGVVCGLEVRCDPCGSHVIVPPGYALSPCGEDIVVCRDQPVDVCDLIKQCRPPKGPDCTPRVAAGADPCQSQPQQWVLAIRYAETLARSTRPLGVSRDPVCGCGTSSTAAGGCGCGGAKNGNGKNGDGCTCHGTVTARAPAPSSSCRTVPECEPSLVCEGYHFEVYRLVTPGVRDPVPKGAMIDRFLCCYQDLVDSVPQAPPAGSGPADEYAWLCGLKQGFQDFLASHPYFDCGLSAWIAAVSLPSPNADLTQAKQDLLQVFVGFLMGCICSALQPQCPKPVSDPRVPLAVVTVQDDGITCRVLSVCNWTSERRFVTTFPALRYWLSWIPLVRQFRQRLERLCCRPLVPVRSQATFASGFAYSMRSSSPSAAGLKAEAASLDFARLLVEALRRAGPASDEALFNSILGGDLTGSGETISALEQANLLPFILLNQLGRPIIESLAPAWAGAAAGEVATEPAAGEERSFSADVEAMTEQLESLRAQVRSQQDMIDSLLERLRGGGGQ
jgi:hypothetical protein